MFPNKIYKKKIKKKNSRKEKRNVNKYIVRELGEVSRRGAKNNVLCVDYFLNWMFIIWWGADKRTPAFG